MSIRYYKLFELLHRRNITKTEFMKDIGFSPTTVSKLYNNKIIRMDVIDRICDYLDCQPDDIMEHYKTKK